MAKINLNDIQSIYDLTKLNQDFADIEAEFQNKVLYRDNPVGEPNQMENDLDMNSNRVLNLPKPTSNSEAARLADVQAGISGNQANLIEYKDSNVEEALNNRVIRVSSRAEMKAYDVPAGYQFSLEEGGRSGLFVRRAGTPPVSDPQEGVYVIADNGGYDERIDKSPAKFGWFGAAGSGDESTKIQAALNSNLRFVDEGIFYVNDITFPENASVSGPAGSLLTFKLASEGLLAEISNNNTTLENVVFDGDNIPLTQQQYKEPVLIPANVKRPRLKNVRFINFRGSNQTGINNQITLIYGLTVDLRGVKDFEFKSLYFDNITNQGDKGGAAYGFCGGVFLINRDGLTINIEDRSTGTIDGVAGKNIFTRYPTGSTVSEKQLDNDADLIRLYSDTLGNGVYNITIKNVYGVSVGKRIVKSSYTGIVMENIVCDGTQPPDTDVPMASIIKQSNGINTLISNVRGDFDSYTCTAPVQLLDDQNTTVDTLTVDNCLWLVQTTGTSKDLTLNNIDASVNGGLSCMNTSSTNTGTWNLSNITMRFDRLGTYASLTSLRGFSITNVENLLLNNISMDGGQVLIEADFLSYDNFKVVFNYAVDPSTTGMGTLGVMQLNVANLQMGKLTLDISDSLPNYLPALTGMVRIFVTKSATGGETVIKSLNNSPVSLFRCNGDAINLGKFYVKTNEKFEIGDAGATTSGVSIDQVELVGGTAQVRLIRTIDDLVIGRVIKRINAASNPLFTTNNLAISDSYVERVFWQPNGGIVAAPAGLTVIDTQTFS